MTLLLVLTGANLGLLLLLGVFTLRQSSRNQMSHLESSIDRLGERLERAMHDESSIVRRELSLALHGVREELSRRLDLVRGQIGEDSKSAREELREIAELSRKSVESQLIRLTTDNAQKLEEMRRTVGEKLEGTLERRLGDSFRLVSERLELVHKGLGEMQTLAVGVGDLKKVMTNVKTRGTWGEIQLGSLLEQILAPEQFDRNVATKSGSNGRVEYAIKMPGRDIKSGKPVWLPIDAKFPVETYQRLVEAQDKAHAETAENEARQLEAYIKICAKEICDKYLSPPDTTDFGVMYLPTEGLFAEVARRTGLIEYIQRECRVIVAGPTTLAALLNSLQMGFRTLAIQKRSSEVWEVLGAVKSEFGKFEDVLKKVEKKLQEAGNVIESVNQRSRVIHRKLRAVEELPETDAARLLALSSRTDSGEDDSLF